MLLRPKFCALFEESTKLLLLLGPAERGTDLFNQHFLREAAFVTLWRHVDHVMYFIIKVGHSLLSMSSLVLLGF